MKKIIKILLEKIFYSRIFKTIRGGLYLDAYEQGQFDYKIEQEYEMTEKLNKLNCQVNGKSKGGCYSK